MGSPGQRLKKALPTIKHAGTRRAVTYAATQEDATGATVVSVRDVNREGYVNVRLDENETQGLTEDPRQGFSVRCLNAADWKEGVGVLLGRGVDGEEEVIGTDDARNLDSFGAHAAAFKRPLVNGNLDMSIIPGWRLEPLRVRPDSISGGLNVVIEDGIYEYAGTSVAFTDKTPIDLGSISVSSGMRRPVIIGVDPATNTAITAYGDEVMASGYAFTIIDYNNVRTANPGKIWPFAYERKDGVTAFRSIYDLIYIGALYNPTGIAGGVGFMPIDLGYELTIPPNQQFVVDYMTTVDGGSLINYGILRTA
jgi:hypothetical protein